MVPARWISIDSGPIVNARCSNSAVCILDYLLKMRVGLLVGGPVLTASLS